MCLYAFAIVALGSDCAVTYHGNKKSRRINTLITTRLYEDLLAVSTFIHEHYRERN